MKTLTMAALLITIGLWSCKGGGGGKDGDDDDKPVVKTMCDSASFALTVKPIFAKYCNDVAGCHASGAGNIDLRKNSTSKNAALDPKYDFKKAINYQSDTAVENMPPAGKLSKRDIDIIECWMSKGFPE